MMYPRLLLANHMLKETGIIIIAIDDGEQSRLKLLLDRVFGAENFISNVVWQSGRKNDSRYISNGAECMLVYAKNEGQLAALDTKWREEKKGIGDALRAAEKLWTASYGEVDASAKWKTWLKTRKASGEITDSVVK